MRVRFSKTAAGVVIAHLITQRRKECNIIDGPPRVGESSHNAIEKYSFIKILLRDLH